MAIEPDASRYPLFLNLQGRSCLVFGGGEVATRKVESLLKRGARVICVSKEFSNPLKRLVGAPFMAPKVKDTNRQKGVMNHAPTLQLKRARTNRISLKAASLVIAATSDRNFNARVARACRKKKIWVNVVDQPESCDFYVPAVLERGPLQIAISTNGTSPLFARRLREELEKAIPISTGRLLEKLGRIRKFVKKK